MEQIQGKVLEVHEVFPKYYDYIRNYQGTISFDDGLYSQYQFLRDNPDVCQRSIVFVSPKTIRNELEYPYDKVVVLCDVAHAMYVLGDRKSYMSLTEIAELKKLGVRIGYHSYNHLNISQRYTKASEKLKEIKFQVQMMLDYQENFGIFDNIFCVPYNDYSILNIYLKLLEKETNENFQFVKDREPLELLPEMPKEYKNLYNRKMFSIDRLPFHI